MKVNGMPYGWAKYYRGMAKRNFKYSSASKGEENIEWVVTKLRILTHEIDKGLAMNTPRKGFGKEKVNNMLRLMDKYIEFNQYDYEYDSYLDACEILEKYIDNKDKYQLDVSNIQLEKYKRQNILRDRISSSANYDIMDAGQLDFKTFAQSRHSIRTYAKDSFVTKDEFRDIIKLARTAPSACNRQSVHAILVNEKDKVDKIMEIQGGNNGFYGVNNCIIIASDLNSYWYDGEMNTAFVDGGLFMMNLIYSLKYYGYDCCPLIWDDYSDRRKKLSKIINLSHNMVIIGMLTVGKANKNAKILCSPRKDTSNIILNVN